MSGREILLDAVITPFRKSRIEVEKIVSFKFKQRLGNLQLARISHRVRYVIELRGVINRSEEAGQVIEEGIVATANERLDCLAVWGIDGQDFVDIDCLRKTATGKV